MPQRGMFDDAYGALGPDPFGGYMQQLVENQNAVVPGTGVTDMWNNVQAMRDQRDFWEAAQYDLQAFGMTPILGVSDAAGVLGDTVMYAREPEKLTWDNLKWSALGAVPFVPGSIRGLQRIPPLYHGAKVTEDAQQILDQGFRRGQSAELKTPGTSLSRDPAVSLGGFALHSPMGMLEVTPRVDPGSVYNMRPSEYVTGHVPDEMLFNKPNAGMFMEAETFLRRQPVGADELAALEAERARLFEIAQSAAEKAHGQPLGSAAHKQWAEGLERVGALDETIMSRAAGETVPVDVRRPPPERMKKLQKQTVTAMKAMGEIMGTGVQDLGKPATLPKVAQSIRELRGHRGKFDQGMHRLARKLVSAEHAHRTNAVLATQDPEGLAVLAKVQPGAAANAAEIQAMLTTALRPGAAHLTAVQRQRLVDAGLLDTADRFLAAEDVAQMLDDASRLWVRERNALADRIESLYPRIPVGAR